MGSRNIKINKGKKYLYYVVSEDGKKRAIYCGLASKLESEKKALKLELEELHIRKKILVEKTITVQNKLKNI